MIFLHVHSQQIYSFFRHVSALSVLHVVAGVLICCVLAGCAVNREKQSEVKYDMMENLTARFNIVYHGRKIIADVMRDNFEAHRDNYQQLLPVLIEPTDATASSNTQLMIPLSARPGISSTKKLRANTSTRLICLPAKRTT